jgi:insertion element IS1 protein InsB
VNPAYPNREKAEGVTVDIASYNSLQGIELDEQRGYAQNKGNRRWLWPAIDHQTHDTIAYTFGRRTDEVFLELKALIEPLPVAGFYTDDRGSYERRLEADNHKAGKENTRSIERKNLTLRTRVKRLTRRTICFSKLALMHDTVIGLFINTREFGLSFD